MRLFFLTSTRIGDAILSSGLLDHLLRQHPDARLTLACGAVSAPLFAAIPNLERLIAIRKRPYKLHWPALWLSVANRRWDLAVDLRASAIGYLIPARQRKVVKASDPSLPRVVELARLLGLDEVPAPRVWTTAEDEALAGRLIPPGPPLLIVGPCANWIGKQWPADRFAEVARRLTGPDGPLPDGRIAVLAAAHERRQARQVLERVDSDRILDLGAERTLPEAAACLRRATLFVGNDSGLMHLAAAAGTPTLGLFGPTPDRRYGPWGPHCAVVRTPEAYADLKAGIAGREASVTATLMASLTVESVTDAALALWDRVRGDRAWGDRVRDDPAAAAAPSGS